MSAPSPHSLQTLSDSESMLMSNGHQPLAGDADFISWSEEDISTLVAALRGDESSPEVRAQLDALFNASEESLLDAHEHALAGPADAQADGSNNDESPAPQQGTSVGVEHVENAQASFPTLENFTAPVADLPQLPQIDGNSYHPPQPSADQAPTQDDALPQHEHDAGHAMDEPPSEYNTQSSTAPQGAAWSQHGYYPGYHANGLPGAYYWQPSAAVQAAPQGYAWPLQGYHVNGPPGAYHWQPSAAVQAASGYAWPQLGYHPAPSHPGQQPQTVAGPSYPYQQPRIMGPFYPYQQPHTVAGPFIVNYPTGAFPQGQNALLQMGAGGESTVQPPFTASGKRKAGQMVASGDVTSYIVQRPYKRRRANCQDHGPGKFGPYMLSDASATVMPMPVHDPQPVDISNRKTYDLYGNPLRTRRFGVMELEDIYHHSSGLICVRPCDWTDQPCGLFVEVDKVRIEEHLLHWHGVTMENDTTCRFKDCPELKPMQYLSRHIESVHFDTCYRCPYCYELCGRTDSLRRHQRRCQILSDSRQRAMLGGYDFHLKDRIKLVHGYIVPAKSAT